MIIPAIGHVNIRHYFSYYLYAYGLILFKSNAFDITCSNRNFDVALSAIIIFADYSRVLKSIIVKFLMIIPDVGNVDIRHYFITCDMLIGY
jgi:hypothetical protein